LVLVIDASVALAWCFKDEATPATDALVPMVRRDGATVPVHWLLEVTNALLVAERRGRIMRNDVATHLRTIAALGVQVDLETDRHVGHDILALARADGLSIYDAAYLELAQRMAVPLATLDKDLAKAARKSGVTVRP
jgi:predicted nucleic acid-binding protein